MDPTTLGAERASNPFLRELAAPVTKIQAPRGTYDVLPDTGGRARPARAHRREDPRARGLRPDRDADLRGHAALQPHGGGGDGRRPEGDVHVPGRQRGQPDAAAGGHRAGRARLPRARHAQGAAAGEALVPLAASSATSARRPAASASSGRSGWRRSGRADPAVDAEVILLLGRAAGGDRRARRQARARHARPARVPRRLPRGAERVPARATRTSSARRSSTGSTSTRCARSTPSTSPRSA